jgi:hypothetical protein
MIAVALVVSVGARFALILVAAVFLAGEVLTFAAFGGVVGGDEGDGEDGRKEEEYEKLVHCVG